MGDSHDHSRAHAADLGPGGVPTVDAQFDGGAVTGTATTSVTISDFGMTPPRAGPVISIEDGLTLGLAFNAARNA
jgi:hypothetical protein